MSLDPAFLQRMQANGLGRFASVLVDLGVEEAWDLKFLNEQDLIMEGIPVEESRKLLSLVTPRQSRRFHHLKRKRRRTEQRTHRHRTYRT